jgi:hypothetical protein
MSSSWQKRHEAAVWRQCRCSWESIEAGDPQAVAAIDHAPVLDAFCKEEESLAAVSNMREFRKTSYDETGQLYCGPHMPSKCNRWSHTTRGLQDRSLVRHGHIPLGRVHRSRCSAHLPSRRPRRCAAGPLGVFVRVERLLSPALPWSRSARIRWRDGSRLTSSVAFSPLSLLECTLPDACCWRSVSRQSSRSGPSSLHPAAPFSLAGLIISLDRTSDGNDAVNVDGIANTDDPSFEWHVVVVGMET